MRAAIDRLGLDLRGLTVATEAGSGAFALTPVLAAMAGAQVRALTRASAWGSVGSIRDTVAAACDAAGVSCDLVHVTEDRVTAFEGGRIVTNLGFVRPIDRAAVEQLADHAVVALMCEAWEVRPGDIDFEACRDHGVLVLGTNEHHPLCDVFRFSGPLAGRLLLEAGFEVLGVRVAVIGRDAFAPAIAGWLRAAGARVTWTNDDVQPSDVEGAEAILVCEYASDELIVGPGGRLEPQRIARLAPGATVVQFAGRIDRDAILLQGLGCWPEEPVGPHRMVRTFSALGPGPVIDLHAGGLKVAELGVRGWADASDAIEAEIRAARSDLVQRMPRVTGAHR
jgi:hypothetical protein